MGIIDIPGERLNLAGKEATSSLSYLRAILEMTIATSQGGDTGWDRCRGAMPQNLAVHGVTPHPYWVPGQPGPTLTAAEGPCVAQTGVPATVPHPNPIRAPRATRYSSFSCRGAHGGWKELFQPSPSSSTGSSHGTVGLCLLS